MSRARGTGFIPERFDLSGRVGSAYRGYNLGAVALPDIHTIWPVRTSSEFVMNQGRTNSCLGHYVTYATDLWRLSRGIDAPRVSPWFPYWTARRVAARTDKVEDNGSRVSSMIRAANRFGLCQMDRWKPAKLDVNRKPGSMAFITAQKTKLDMIPIYSSGDRLIERVCDSLAKDQPVLIALGVDREFLDNHGYHLISSIGRDHVGLHALTVYGYRTTIGGHRVFSLVNSWGRLWRADGTAEITETVLVQSRYTAALRAVVKRAA